MSVSVTLPQWFRKSPTWFLSFAAAVTACVVILLVNVWVSEVQPGNPWGIGYGVAAAGMFAGAMLYVVRRRAPRRGPSTAHNWLQFHVYGGTLFLLLVLMHTGLRLPQGVLGWSLWILSAWVVTTGILGTFVQKWIPRLLTSGLSTEAHYDRIGELVEGIRRRAADMVHSGDDTLRQFYDENLAVLLANPAIRPIYFIDITGGIQSRVRQFRYLRGVLPPEQKERLDTLETLTITKLELDAHYTLQKALRWWLYGHVPFSVVLVALIGFHLFSVLFY